MAGVKGRSGGHNRKPVESHLRLGTFRPKRHGHLLVAVPLRAQGAAAPQLGPNVPPIPGMVFEGLSDRGRRFVAALWSESEFSGADLELLRQTGRALDDAEQAPNPRDRRQGIRTFAALLLQLKVE